MQAPEPRRSRSAIGALAGSFSTSGHTEWVDGKIHETGFTTVFGPNTKVPYTTGGVTYDVDLVDCREGSATCVNPSYAAVTSRSFHVSVVHSLLCDGAVRSVSDNIDLTLWRNLGSRNDGNVIGGEW